MAASKMKNGLFRILSHELKTPLVALIGLTDVLSEALKDKVEAIDLLLGEMFENRLRLARPGNEVGDFGIERGAGLGGSHRNFLLWSCLDMGTHMQRSKV